MTETTSTQPAAKVELDLEPGTVVGEYQVEGKLGQGGFGAVFKAQHPLIGKVVAIKVLAPKFSADPEMVQRFIAEARAVNQIRHRNIIDIFSFGQLPDGRHYYVMEYLEGDTLDKLIDHDHVLAPEVALPILRAIAKALDAAHAKGIAHRDLKPENVFLAKDADGDGYWAKLLDFGIAKLLAAEDGNKVKTRTGIPIGTPYYMSPEQCRGKDVDHRTDYYAFGVVAYQMLTGTYPIDAEDYMSILMKQMSEEPRPPSQVNPALPSGVDDAIAWLMRKDPAERPPNLVTAVRALEASVEASGIALPKHTWDSTTPHQLERPPTPPPRGSKTPGAFAETAAAKTPGAFAATVASTSSVGEPSTPARRGNRLRWLGAFSAVAVAGGALFVLKTQSKGDAKPAATTPVAVAAMAPPPADATVLAQAPTVDAATVPELPKQVALTIEHAPAGSEVFAGDKLLGTAPGPFMLDRGSEPVEIAVRHAGFMPVKVDVVPDQARTIDGALHPMPKRPPPPGSKPPLHRGSAATDPHDIEDPFTRK